MNGSWMASTHLLFPFFFNTLICWLLPSSSSQFIIIRGGCVFLEAGAIGGMFVGVIFVEDPNPAEVSTVQVVVIISGLT